MASASASSKASCWAALAGWSGSSEQARCDHSPVTRIDPSSWAARAAVTSASHSSRGAPPRESPVSTLSWTRPDLAGLARAADDLLELGDRVGGHVDVRLDERREVGARSGQPAQQPPGVTGRAQGERLGAGGRRRATRPRPRGRPGRPAPCRGRSRRPSPRPSAAPSDWPSQTSSRSRRTLCRIAPRSTTTSACGLGGRTGHGGTILPFSTRRARTTSGIASATAVAVSGPPPLARVAAAPCSHEPTDAASQGSRPAASSEPITPASTSPAPATASQGTPLVVTAPARRGGRPACAGP